MSKISDELREFIDEGDLYPRYIAELRRIADRIDADMVELPKDVDGQRRRTSMSKISDELRNWCDDPYMGRVDNLYSLADRVDAEMVELPISADGKIWTGREECFWIEARGGAWSRHSLLSLDIIDGSRWYVRDTGGIEYEAGAAWFERPDSFERIADELEAWCDGADVDGDAGEKPRDLAMRIRRLAQVRAHGAQVVR